MTQPVGFGVILFTFIFKYNFKHSLQFNIFVEDFSTLTQHATKMNIQIEFDIYSLKTLYNLGTLEAQISKFIQLIIKMNTYTAYSSKLPVLKFRHSISTLQTSQYHNSQDFSPVTQSLFQSCSDKNIKQIEPLNGINTQNFALMLAEEQKKESPLRRIKTYLNQIEKRIKNAKPILNTVQSRLLSFNSSEQNGTRVQSNNETGQKNNEAEIIQKITAINELSPNSLRNKSKKQKKYYVSEIFDAIKGTNLRASDHFNFSINVFKNFSSIKPPTFGQIHQRKLRLARRKQDLGKPTLVLDIDETLIHCQENPILKFDTILAIATENGSIAQAFIGIRPYAISFLKKMSKHFQIISFTAGHQSYADVVLDVLDPNHEYIRHRLYRKHCTQVCQNLLVKDLRIIDRDLSRMVLVDNAPYSYVFQPENGIPILPFYSGEDNELYKLQKYLMQLLKSGDMRELNKSMFQFHRFNQFSKCKELAEELYFSQI